VTTELDDAQRAFFLANGYLRLERVVDDASLVRLREIYDEVLEDPGPFHIDHKTRDSRRGSLRQIFFPEQPHPELLDSSFFTTAVRMAAQLLGVTPVGITPRSHLIFKPARYGVETPWHQDMAYRTADRTQRSVNIWLALDDAPVEAGCMQFVPRSHLGEVLPHSFVVDTGAEITDVKEAQGVDPSLAVPCPVRAGGATFHTVRTLHYTGPNRTDQQRRAWIIILEAA
jgi:ectoine hydroxylase-related dioxygenase (phytanoyl-CoA dioxygenase family)